MKKLAYLIILATGLASCKTSSLMLDVLYPAHISVPNEIRTLAVINRSMPSKEQEVNNVVEGLLTGEGVANDRFGSRECVKGFANAISNSPRYDVVVPGLELKGTGTSTFPPPLSWEEVGRICDEAGADALVSLETFDTDYSKGGILSKPAEHPTIEVKTSSGWRIYDPAVKQLLDENVYIDHSSWESRDRERIIPIPGLTDRSRAAQQAGYFSGTQYARRISPSWVSVSRMYYKKGNQEFKTAKRLVASGMYDDAADIWIRYTDHPDRKIAGYACYNMALATEIQGDLGGAFEWARKSIVQYGNKKGGQYMNVLNNRISQARRLDEQLK